MIAADVDAANIASSANGVTTARILRRVRRSARHRRGRQHRRLHMTLFCFWCLSLPRRCRCRAARRFGECPPLPAPVPARRRRGDVDGQSGCGCCQFCSRVASPHVAFAARRLGAGCRGLVGQVRILPFIDGRSAGVSRVYHCSAISPVKRSFHSRRAGIAIRLRFWRQSRRRGTMNWWVPCGRAVVEGAAATLGAA